MQGSCFLLMLVVDYQALLFTVHWRWDGCASNEESKTIQRLALEAFINSVTFGKFLPNQLCDSLHKSYMQSSSDANIGEFCNIFISKNIVDSLDSVTSEITTDDF